MSAQTTPPSAQPARPLLLGTQRSGDRQRTATFVLLASTVGVVVAILTVRSPQLGAAAALVGLVVTAFIGHAPTGLAALWALWLLAPGLRRVFGFQEGYVDLDPLAVAPFAATGVVAVLAFLRIGLPRRGKLVLGAAGAGLALGVPAALANPAAGAFAAVAYAAGVSAFVIGWSEGDRPLSRWSLTRALAVGAPVVAVYALYQYFVALPPWDGFWLEQAEFGSGGAPEEGKVRAFSTLNAPAILALVLALSLLLQLVRRRVGPGQLITMTLATLTLAVTYVRSTWLALVAAVLVLTAVTRGRAAPQLFALVAVLATAGLALTFSQGTFDAFVERVSTFGDLDSDISITEREERSRELLPDLLVAPLGYGLGSAGEATRLSDSGVRTPDNGYVSMAYQVGIPGALLLLAGPILATWTSARAALGRDPRRTAATLTAIFAFYLVLLLTGDQFYGLSGAILWYLVGAALARAHAGRSEGPEESDGRLAFAPASPPPPYSATERSSGAAA